MEHSKQIILAKGDYNLLTVKWFWFLNPKQSKLILLQTKYKQNQENVLHKMCLHKIMGIALENRIVTICVLLICIVCVISG